ncbi:hypothetical protein WR25_03179 [Diploscapter pachys]|uniref:Serine/threonine specific protein phosphatases domain-containing protein n=1 Tax=Diploscapter pachys TaxID=2018661 RepID=A0A2A2L800_9BILA|nr:hypothetical protein WR25_03179 [Diploscapter pachys]
MDLFVLLFLCICCSEIVDTATNATNMTYNLPFCHTEDNGLAQCSVCVNSVMLTADKAPAKYDNKDVIMKLRLGCEGPYNASNEWDRSMSCLTHAHNISAANFYIVGLVEDTLTTRRIFKKCCKLNQCNDRESITIPYYLKSLTIIQLRSSNNDKVIFENYGGEMQPIRTAIIAVVVCIIYKAIFLFVCFVKGPVDEKTADYSPAIDSTLLRRHEELGFDPIDTGIPITGLLTIDETCHVLAVMADPRIAEEVDIQARSIAAGEDEKAQQQQKDTVRIRQGVQMRSAGYGHTLVKCIRSRPLGMELLLHRMVENGPYAYPFSFNELLCLFDEAMDVFCAEPTLIKLDSEVIVLGDIRGSYLDLHRWLSLVGWPPRTKLLFLGGIVDNADLGSMECMALLAALKVAFPNHVYILRGATETLHFTPGTRFHKKTSNALSGCMSRMWSHMPYAAIIHNHVLCVPSGISHLVKSLTDLETLPRPVRCDSMTFVQKHLVFSVPSSKVHMYRPRRHESRGDVYGSSAVSRICADLRVKTIIRGHSVLKKGFCISWNQRLISIWSSPASHGCKKGCVLRITESDIIPIFLASMVCQTYCSSHPLF